MLEEYTRAAQTYLPYFEEKGFFIKTGLMWKRFPDNVPTFCRGEIQNGYQCYVFCSVQRKCRDAVVPSNDGEAKWYSLSNAYMVSSVNKDFCRLTISLFGDTNEINDDLSCFLRQLQCVKDIEIT